MAHEWWVDLDISFGEREELKVTGHGPYTMEASEKVLEPRVSRHDIDKFGAWVREAALAGHPLSQRKEALSQAQGLYKSLLELHSDVLKIVSKLQGPFSEKIILLQFNLEDPLLKSIPWEALCEQGAQSSFLCNSINFWPVRGIKSTSAFVPREVKDAVRLLVISPEDADAPERLKGYLAKPIDMGLLEWMAPLSGHDATLEKVQETLQHGPCPHILHFMGHGGVNAQQAPFFQMAGLEGEPGKPYLAEHMAQDLAHAFNGDLRLVVLESCKGAQPGELSSAAECLAKSGASAVVGHLWPVKMDVAEVCSKEFYGSLLINKKNVAESLNLARHNILSQVNQSAEAFSPVLYLRGHEPRLFTFRRTTRSSPSRSARVQPAVTTAGEASLLELLRAPFTLVLGDHWADQTPEEPQRTLREKLQDTPLKASEALPMSSLAQRYELLKNRKALRRWFAEQFRADPSQEVPLVWELARWLKPGVHISLLRQPVLELALAERQPELSIWVIYPNLTDDSLFIQSRLPGKTWVDEDVLPSSSELDKGVVLLRLYNGYSVKELLEEPLLTEDDFLRIMGEFMGIIDREAQHLGDKLLATVNHRPSLLLGLSLLSWDHRHLLRYLLGGQLTRESTVLLEPGDHTADAWREKKGVPVASSFKVLQREFSELAQILEGATP